MKTPPRKSAETREMSDFKEWCVQKADEKASNQIRYLKAKGLI